MNDKFIIVTHRIFACMASSVVGTIISIRGRRGCREAAGFSTSCSLNFWTRGSRYASVFPLPAWSASSTWPEVLPSKACKGFA